MRKIYLFLAILLGLGMAKAGNAQPSAGASEVSFGAAYYEFTDGDADGVLLVNARYGYFLTDAFELGGGLFASGSVDDLDQTLSAEVFAVYHFTPEETNTWYVKGAYFTILDEPGDGFLDVAGGIKAYFSTNAAFFWEAGYGTSISDNVDGGIIRSLAGLTFTF